MPFQPGHKLGKGGPRPNSGRPRKEQVEIERTATQIAREMLEKNAARIMGSYLGFADEDAATARHAVDKLIPNEQQQFQAPVFNITFATYQHHNPAQLPPKDISVAVLASDGQDSVASEGSDKTSRKSLASPERQGQDGLKFHNFSDVPGE